MRKNEGVKIGRREGGGGKSSAMFSNLAVTLNSDRLDFGKFKDLNIYGTKDID